MIVKEKTVPLSNFFLEFLALLPMVLTAVAAGLIKQFNGGWPDWWSLDLAVLLMILSVVGLVIVQLFKKFPLVDIDIGEDDIRVEEFYYQKDGEWHYCRPEESLRCKVTKKIPHPKISKG